MILFHVSGINIIQIYILMKIIHVHKCGEKPSIKILDAGSSDGSGGDMRRDL